MEVRALAEPPLHRRIRESARFARMSIGNWILKAAEEKLAREAKKDAEAA